MIVPWLCTIRRSLRRVVEERGYEKDNSANANHRFKNIWHHILHELEEVEEPNTRLKRLVGVVDLGADGSDRLAVAVGDEALDVCVLVVRVLGRVQEALPLFILP